MARAPRALTLLAALLLAACPRGRQELGPAPVAMTPSEGSGLAPLPVVIVGDRFDASAQTDFEQGSGTLSATFQARLLPEAGGGAVALGSVRLTAARALEATVPAGIPRGSYALEVTDPSGRVGTLPRAFRVFSDPANVAAFLVTPAEPAHAGIPFLVNLTAVDGAGVDVDGFAGQVTLSDLSGALSPTTAGPFVGGRFQARLTVQALWPGDRITATDALGNTGSSAAFDVVPGPPVALAFKSAPATETAGACSALVTVELRDSMGFASPPSTPVGVEIQASPAGSLTFHTGGGSCSPATAVTAVAISAPLATASFHYTGPTPGSALIRAVPAGLPSVTFGVTLSP